MPLIPVLRGKSLIVLLFTLILAISPGSIAVASIAVASTAVASTAVATPVAWPEGWSTPVPVASGHRNQGYASATLGTRTLLIATVSDKERDYVLQVETVDVFSKQHEAVLTLPVQGLNSYMVFSHGETGSLGFVQRIDGVSRIYVQSIPTAGTTASAPLLLYESTGVIADFTAVSDNRGNVFYAWSSNEQGLRNVFLQVRDTAGTILWVHMIDSPHTVDTTPFVAVDDSVLYLLNRESRGAVTELVYVTRYMRASMLEVVNQDYIRTARAKGLAEKKVVLVHALRNALLPIITLIGFELPILFSGSVVIESIFSWPGIGLLAWRAVLQRDYQVVMAFNLLGASMMVIGTFIADMLYLVADPRIKYN